MKQVIKNTGRAILLSAAILTSAIIGKVHASALSPAPNDSVNRAVALIMAINIDNVLSELSNSNVPLDRIEIGKYMAEYLAGKDLGFDKLTATNYVDKLIRANYSYLPDSLSLESQKEFLKEAANISGAVVTPSGLIFSVITEGEGVYPTIDDAVKVRYVARLSDGTVFDDTEDELVKFDLDRVIHGFSEGVRMMKPGGTYRLIIPPELGYGAEGIPGIIPPNAVLDFTITLEEIIPNTK